MGLSCSNVVVTGSFYASFNLKISFECKHICSVLAGADIASGPVWMEYIAFLKSLPVWKMFLHCSDFLTFSSFYCLPSHKTMLQAQTMQEETQRMTAVRKVYQRAIVTPTHHIEQLWRDYENFENSVSRALVASCLWLKFFIMLILSPLSWASLSDFFSPQNSSLLDW